MRRPSSRRNLVIYGGGPTTLYEAPAKAFEQKYPGIKVTIHAGFGNVLDAQINQQIKDKKLVVDLAILQTVQDFIRWKKEIVLARFKPAGWREFDKSFKDHDATTSECSSPRCLTPTTKIW